MALHESVLEEFGLAPRWVRRGMAVGHESAVAQEQAAALDAQVAPPRAAARGSAGAQEPAVAPEASVAPAQAAAQTPAVLQKTDAATNAARGGDGIAQGRTAGPASQAQPQPTQPTQRLQPADDSYTAPTAQPSRAPEPQRAPSSNASGDPQPAQARPSADPASFDAPPDDGFAWFDDLPLHPPGESDAAVPALPAINTLDWDALSERVASCERCRLCEKRTKTVFGVGDRQADWMLIGEAPGENEDRVGEPFVGQAGKLLDNMLRSLTLARGANVYIANVIKCRPPGNRNPEPDEVARCEPYLQRQVALVKPKLIVALGRFAAQSLLKTDASISSLRGRVHEYEGVPVVVTYHPAYLLRSLPDKAKAWADLCLARDTWREGGGTPSDAPKQ